MDLITMTGSKTPVFSFWPATTVLILIIVQFQNIYLACDLLKDRSALCFSLLCTQRFQIKGELYYSN